MTDFITVCKVGRDKLATKTHAHTSKGWETTSFDAGYHVQARPAKIASLGELHTLLSVLATKHMCFVVRGALREGVNGGAPHVRRYHWLEPSAEHPNPEDPSYEPVDHHWICLDVDDFIIPEQMRAPGRGGDVLDMVRRGLPAWLNRAGMIMQWSSSAGLDGFKLAKLHIWVWCDRPVCGFSLREWFKGWNDENACVEGAVIVDCALYNPVQPHYTAHPMFKDGTQDPLIREADVVNASFGRERCWVDDRIVRYVGAAATPPASILGLSAWEAKEERTRIAEQKERAIRRAVAENTKRSWRRGSDDAARANYASASFESAKLAVMQCEGDPSWYEEYRKETFSTYGLVAAGALDEHVWRATWEDIGARPGALPGRKMSPKDIKRLLDGAEKRAPARDLSGVTNNAPPQREQSKKTGFASKVTSWQK